MDERYVRNFPAISEEDQQELKNKTVAVVGCGGLGGYIINGFARLGIGRLILIDCDVFAESNLNRQLFCNEKNLGKSKSDEAAKAVKKINSNVKTKAFNEFLTADNAEKLLKGADIVIDALDNIEGRFVAESACEKLGLYLIHGAASRWYCQASTVAPGSKTIEKIYPKGYKGKAPSVLAFAPGFTANIQIAEALKVLLHKAPSLEGKLLIADLEHMTFNAVDI